ncbi:MAG: thioesterase family protein [Nitriliruptorales bacterium]
MGDSSSASGSRRDLGDSSSASGSRRDLGDAFYLLDGDRFRSTELTRGPWSHDHQHAGPPNGLLARAMEAVDGGEAKSVARYTAEILRQVPITTLTVSAEVVRPGRRVDLVEGTLGDDDGPIIRARAWRIRRQDVDGVPDIARAGGPPEGPESGREVLFFETGADVGYHTAMEARFVRGAFREPGPALAWLRMRGPLVEGEEPSSLQRVLVAADSGNGLSATLDYHAYVFINTDLSVHLHRDLAGEWVCLDARTVVGSDGRGLAETTVADERGVIGRGLQTLFVEAR